MARRDLPTSEDKDVEASQAELAVLEGKKNQTQEETLAVAKNKQELEDAFAAAKKQLDEELQAKRATHAKALDDMEQKHRNIEMALSTIESVHTMTKEETARLEAACNGAKEELLGIQDLLAKDKAEVTRLGILKHNLEEGIKDYRTDLRELNEKIEPLKKEHADLLITWRSTSESNAALTGNMLRSQEVLNKIKEEAEGLTTTLVALGKRIDEKKELLFAANGELIDVQKKVSDHKQAMAALDAEISTKAGNAARLEQHVDKKLTHLKEIEKQFTTEHLARFGYKKTENNDK